MGWDGDDATGTELLEVEVVREEVLVCCADDDDERWEVVETWLQVPNFDWQPVAQ